MHKGNVETWIKGRAYSNANPGHKGRHGIYRAHVTRPASRREGRVESFARRIVRACNNRFAAHA